MLYIERVKLKLSVKITVRDAVMMNQMYIQIGSYLDRMETFDLLIYSMMWWWMHDHLSHR